MTELERWYEANKIRVGQMGFKISSPSDNRGVALDGEYGPYMFRFIDRLEGAPDIEIMNYESGEVIYHDLIVSECSSYLIYDKAVDFISHLKR